MLTLAGRLSRASGLDALLARARVDLERERQSRSRTRSRFARRGR
jgi:hypothetical protein